jgi:hypothetical protein
MAGLARRIHIAGSASKQCAPEKLRYAHELVRGFTRAHSLSGALVAAGEVESRGATGAVLVVAASQNGLYKIPDARKEAWERLLTAGAVQPVPQHQHPGDASDCFLLSCTSGYGPYFMRIHDSAHS